MGEMQELKGCEESRMIRRPISRRSILAPTMLPLWPDVVDGLTDIRVPLLEAVGFRLGQKGTHTSRTMMLDELTTLLATVPAFSARDAYVAAIIDDNVLGKSTAATRKLTAQRLSELYSLETSVPLFRMFRLFWDRDRFGKPLLALLMTLARDPLLRATAGSVLQMVPGEELARQSLTDAIGAAAGDRLGEGTLDKVVRNAASSWTQSGHLEGRSRKFRLRVSASPVSLAFGLFLGYALGMRGEGLLRSMWIRVLDVSADEAVELAIDAKRLSLLDMKRGGGVTEISFSRLLTDVERGLIHGAS